MTRTALPLLAALACAIAAGCGGDSSLSVRDCTDVDPATLIEAAKPEVVDCDAGNARSRVVAETDDVYECGRGGYVKDDRGVYYCLEQLPGPREGR